MIVTSLLMTLLRKRPGWWLASGVLLLFVCSAAIPAETRASDIFTGWQRLLLVAGQDGFVLFEYPLAPWFAITCLGVGLGQLLEQSTPMTIRASLPVGALLILAALLLRVLGGFGNTRLPRDDSWIEFLNLIKYPPSLVFSLMMVGGNLLLFGLFSRTRPAASRVLVTFGRAPLFFYIAHLYLFALVGALFFRHGASYPVGLGVWAAGLLALYPACRLFERFKYRRPPTSLWRML
jgi:uncharacterized membrane protein